MSYRTMLVLTEEEYFAFGNESINKNMLVFNCRENRVVDLNTKIAAFPEILNKVNDYVINSYCDDDAINVMIGNYINDRDISAKDLTDFEKFELAVRITNNIFITDYDGGEDVSYSDSDTYVFVDSEGKRRYVIAIFSNNSDYLGGLAYIAKQNNDGELDYD